MQTFIFILCLLSLNLGFLADIVRTKRTTDLVTVIYVNVNAVGGCSIAAAFGATVRITSCTFIAIPNKNRHFYYIDNFFIDFFYKIYKKYIKMTLSNDLKIRIINCIKMKKYSDTEIKNIFDISKHSFYKLKNESIYGSKKNIKRSTKINGKIRSYIKSYVVTNINFNYKKLIKLVYQRYNVSISKSSIYDILRESKIKKKRLSLSKY